MVEEKRVFPVYHASTTLSFLWRTPFGIETKHAAPYHLMEGTIGAKCFAWYCFGASNFSPLSFRRLLLEDRKLNTHTKITGIDKDGERAGRGYEWMEWMSQQTQQLKPEDVEKTTDSLCICVSVALLSSHHFNYILCAHRITTTYYMWGFNNNKKKQLYPLSKWKMLLTCILALDFSHGKYPYVYFIFRVLYLPPQLPLCQSDQQ